MPLFHLLFVVVFQHSNSVFLYSIDRQNEWKFVYCMCFVLVGFTTYVLEILLHIVLLKSVRKS